MAFDFAAVPSVPSSNCGLRVPLPNFFVAFLIEYEELDDADDLAVLEFELVIVMIEDRSSCLGGKMVSGE